VFIFNAIHDSNAFTRALNWTTDGKSSPSVSSRNVDGECNQSKWQAGFHYVEDKDNARNVDALGQRYTKRFVLWAEREWEQLRSDRKLMLSDVQVLS